jgi:Flp pilus assembly protein TadD
LLEKAAQGAPANGNIADHLGDAYWAVGRYYEARYAWRAALSVADGSADRAKLEAKLLNGPEVRRR